MGSLKRGCSLESGNDKKIGGKKCKIRINGPKTNHLKGIDFGKNINTTKSGPHLKKKDDEKGKTSFERIW